MEENQSTNKSGSNKKGIIIAAVAVIIILAIAGGGFLFLNKNKLSQIEESVESAAVENSENQQAQVTQAPSMEASSSATSDATYKDGTYKAVGSYNYHSGSEELSVTVILKDGKVEDVTVVNLAKNPTSKKIQDDFIANFKTEVVGKNINEVKLGKVSGSSLTPIGFNAAIEDIKSQAQS